MNCYAIAILAVVAAGFVLHTVADLFNVAALAGPVPDEVADLYPGDMLERSRRYVRESTVETILERSMLLVALLLFWLLGGFGCVDHLVNSWFGHELARGLAFAGLIGLPYSAVSVAFDARRTFGLEARFGFNRTSRATFVADRVKALALTAVLGGSLLAGVLALFLHAGAAAWLLCWVAVVLFSLLVQWLGPALILPLFNRFEPMPTGELRDAVVQYADSVRFPVENVYIIDGSRRSTRANAYFTGLGRRRRIALFDTLVGSHSIPEIVAVLAHEVGHYQLGHVKQALVLTALHAGAALFLLSLVLGQPGLYDALRVSAPSLHSGLVGFALLYAPVDWLSSLVLNSVSRRHEYAADRFAVETAPLPDSFVAALKKLASVNLVHPKPHPFYVVLNYTHPPLVERLRAIASRRGLKPAA